MAGKEFAVKGAVCMCKYGAAPAKLDTPENQFFKLNGSKLTATTKTLGSIFGAVGFGMCKKNPMFPRKCAPAITQWSGFYNGIKTSYGGFPLTDKSKATCSCGTPDCIEFTMPGQIPIPGVKDMQKATKEHQGELDCAASIMALSMHPITTASKLTSGSSQQVLVQRVEGNTESFAGDSVVYKVTKYNIDNVGNNVRAEVKWCLEIDGKREDIKPKGEKIELAIKQEWEGKEIIVMPFMNQPTKNVSVRTKILPCLIIYTSTNKEIFRLDGRNKALYGKKTVKEIYKLGIQWFEPTADYYLPLVSVVKGIHSFTELLHFSWDEIIEFAEENRWMVNYRPNGNGDWKASSKGAKGYILVSIDKIPYWADAIGQIPFTIDYFTDRLEMTWNYDKSKKETIKKAMEYGDGKIFDTEADLSNSYDNAMVLRALNWAMQRYKIKQVETRHGAVKNVMYKTNYSPQQMAVASNGTKIE